MEGWPGHSALSAPAWPPQARSVDTVVDLRGGLLDGLIPETGGATTTIGCDKVLTAQLA